MFNRGVSITSILLVALVVVISWYVHEKRRRPGVYGDSANDTGQPVSVGGFPEERLLISRETGHGRSPVAPTEVEAGSTRAQIAVLVLGEGSGRPMPGIGIFAMATEEYSTPYLIDQFTNTCDDGRVELEVEAGVRLTVYAAGNLGGPLEQDVPCGDATIELQPLLPGERRAVTVEVPAGRDLVFVGRVMDEDSKVPIPYALAVEMSNNYQAVADSAGMLELHVPSWRPGVFELTAEGFGPRRFSPTVGHEIGTEARALLLLPVSTLKVRVFDEGPEPLDSLSVRLSARGHELVMPDATLTIMYESTLWAEDKFWETSCEIDGTCELAGLPAHVPLKAELLRGSEVVQQAGPFGLDPGEIREIDWRLNSGVRLVGRVIDQNGEPVANCTLCRFSPSAGPITDSDRWLLMECVYEEASASTVGDADGRFVFENVVPGTWWIGPCPLDDDPSEIAAVATRFHVPYGIVEHEIAMRVERGLFIRGRVVTPDLSVPERTWLIAVSESMGGAKEAEMTEDGSFQLGPLPPGSYILQASPAGRFASSPEVMALAGDDGVLLHLEWAGKISGKVVSALDRSGREAQLMICGTSGEGLRRWIDADPNGAFEVEGLRAGDYDLTAVTPDGLVAVLRGVAVVQKSTRAGLLLELRPGATVGVRYDGAQDYGDYEIRSGGSVVAVHTLERGAQAMHTVPPGIIEVELRRGAVTVEIRRVELGEGEEETVGFQ